MQHMQQLTQSRSSQNITDPKTKLHARAIANDYYRFILEMSTNAGIVSDALKYVTQKTEQIDTYNGRS
jgi:hypothetical protein